MSLRSVRTQHSQSPYLFRDNPRCDGSIIVGKMRRLFVRLERLCVDIGFVEKESRRLRLILQHIELATARLVCGGVMSLLQNANSKFLDEFSFDVKDDGDRKGGWCHGRRWVLSKLIEQLRGDGIREL